MYDDPADDAARLDRLAALLAAPVPRTPAPELVRRVQTQAAALVMVWFGGFFAVLGLFFVWLFFPWNLPRDLRLALPDVHTAEGRIVSVETTHFSINETSVVAYGFEFSSPDERVVVGRCYTTGERWTPGAVVTVRYAPGDPATACPEGARLSEIGLIGLSTLAFPGLGLGLGLRSLVLRRRAVRMLVQGRPLEVRVVGVEATTVAVNHERVHRITLLRCEPPGAAPQVEKRSDPAHLRLAMERMERGQPMFVLVDPVKPQRTLWIEVF